jgi:hypothetical protein
LYQICMVGNAATLYYPEVYLSFLKNIKYLDTRPDVTLKLFLILNLKPPNYIREDGLPVLAPKHNKSVYTDVIKRLDPTSLYWTSDDEP